MSRPSQVIALSCGEPAGIGPEIAAKAWQALRADACGRRRHVHMLPFGVVHMCGPFSRRAEGRTTRTQMPAGVAAPAVI